MTDSCSWSHSELCLNLTGSFNYNQQILVKIHFKISHSIAEGGTMLPDRVTAVKQ